MRKFQYDKSKFLCIINVILSMSFGECESVYNSKTDRSFEIRLKGHIGALKSTN